MYAFSLQIKSTAFVLAVAGTAFAQVATEPATTSTVVSTDSASEDSKFVIGLRTGYGIAIGKVSDLYGDIVLDKYIKGNIPIWLDLGYKVTPNILLGLYGMYGFGIRGDELSGDCDGCSASMVRFGVQAQYHLSPAENIDPWFGLGIGYESVSLAIRGDNGFTYSGIEFPNFQAGADFKFTPNFGVGPFLSFSLNQYIFYAIDDSTGESVSGYIDERAFHKWLTVGVCGTFSI
jgi:outer membrane protein W